MKSIFWLRVLKSASAIAAVMALGCSATNSVPADDDSAASGAGAAGSTSAANSGAASTASASSSTGPDVTFDWPESTGPCRAGHYVGGFECMYIYQGGAPIPVNGTIDFFLQQTMTGEFFDIGNGKLNAAANIVFVMTADIQGKLDCGTKHFDGALLNGVYSGLFVINGMFDGPLTADYDAPTASFVNGKWELHELTSSFGTCTGTWFANWVP
jgi:hypothetical protein